MLKQAFLGLTKYPVSLYQYDQKVLTQIIVINLE